jgi:hypothetical protein
MIDDTIQKIEQRIRNVASLKEDQKGELLNLVTTLRAEMGELSKTKADHAESITGFVDVSTHEAMREETNPQLLELALQGLSSSVEDFETDHPKLAELVNSISMMLSNIGI